MTQGKRVELSAAQRTDVWERWERGQTGSFPYPENLQSLFAKPALPNNYQKTFRLSPISVPDFRPRFPLGSPPGLSFASKRYGP